MIVFVLICLVVNLVLCLDLPWERLPFGQKRLRDIFFVLNHDFLYPLAVVLPIVSLWPATLWTASMLVGGGWGVLLLFRGLRTFVSSFYGREIDFYVDGLILRDLFKGIADHFTFRQLLTCIVLPGFGLLLLLGLATSAAFVLLRSGSREVLAVPFAIFAAAATLAGLADGSLLRLRAGGFLGRTQARPFLGKLFELFRSPREKRRIISEIERQLEERAQVPESLPKLEGIDVFLLVFESYGMVIHEEPRVAAMTKPALDRFAETLRAGSLHVVSRQLRAATIGGGSWLSHSSILTGLKIDDQVAWDYVHRRTVPNLPSIFRDFGHRTISAHPLMKREWPAGDRLYRWEEHADGTKIPYREESLHRADQYSLDWIAREALARDLERPVFLEFASLASHFPFSPRYRYYEDWDSLGAAGERCMADGPEAEYSLTLDDFKGRAEKPYVESIAYGLDTFAGFLSQRCRRPFVALLVGDHQPGLDCRRSSSVPVHIISSEAGLLTPWKERFGYQDGVFVPPSFSEGEHLSALHHQFVECYRGS